MIRLMIGLVFFLMLTACKKHTTENNSIDNRDILEKLEEIDGIRVQEIDPKNGFGRQFEVYITQLLDHANLSGPTFEQRIFISHTSNEGPVIFMPSGYSSSPVKICELAGAMQANQVYAAHRFMLGAKPDNLEWQYLTIEQASADFHHVVEILSTVYEGAWMSYGVSKNGQAALFHRRFYPEDVKATVALVAPLSQGVEDVRYEQFQESVGTEACRNRIKQFQRSALMKSNEIQPYVNNHMNQSDFTFSRMDASTILEFEVLEFPFSFWQVSDGDYSAIPDSTATAYELFNYIKNFGYLDFYSDELLAYYAPVYYQAYTEMGWYRLIDDHLVDLITEPAPSYRMMAPQDVPLVYDQNILDDIRNWLQTEGNNIIYIYGANDTWTAGAIESTGSTNSLKIVQPNANHTLKIVELDAADAVYQKLEEWLDITINY